MAVNDAVDLFPADLPGLVVFSLDNCWVRRRKLFLSRCSAEKYLALPLDTWPDCGGIPGVTYLQWGHGEGLSEDPRVLNTGGNSGYAAINLAYLKQATRIDLLGFDMDPSEKSEYTFWIAAFRTMLPQLKARGVEIFNHSPSSHIDAFPRVS